MSTNDDWLGPSWYNSWDVADDNWLSEDGALKEVSNLSVWRLVHAFELELLDSGLIGGDGGALDTNTVFFDGLGSVHGDLIVGLVTLLDSEIKVHELDIKIWEDELVLDHLPNNAGHLVSVELDDRGVYLDLHDWVAMLVLRIME